MQINIPARLTPVCSVNFSNFITQTGKDLENKEFIYDFKQMQHCHPYGLLVVACAIRNNIKNRPDAIHRVENALYSQGGRFAANFGFYQSIGFDIGTATEEFDVGDRYIPIKEITSADLHKQYSYTLLLNEKVERHAQMLSDTLVGDLKQSVRDAVQYCFREIMRNTFEHAHTDTIWVCGQYWPSRSEAEIAVLDEGIGILNSLKSNRRIAVKNCLEANSLALQPGLSESLGKKQDPFDRWQNSGYGLYVSSTLCAVNGGYFIISSGDSTLLVNSKDQTPYASNQVGTAICLNIHTDSSKLYSFDSTLAAIVAEGEKKARENGEQRILSASKVTTVASMLKHINGSIESAPIISSLSPLGDKLIPINENVVFTPVCLLPNGDLKGTFEYAGEKVPGILLNVTKGNKALYLRNHVHVNAVVRKYKNGIYNLMESYRYQKALAKTRSKTV